MELSRLVERLEGVDCEQVREAISARLDGETSPVPDEALAAHVRTCAPCLSFEAQAVALHRRFRLAAAAPMPDLTDAVVAAVAGDRAIRTRLWRQWQGTRFALAAVAVVEIALTAPSLVLGHDAEAPVHVAHELGSFGLAIAVGLLVAALRPRLAAGMLPIVAIIAGLLLLTAGTDLATGRTQLGDEAPHLLQIAGFLLLLRLATVTAGPGGDEAGWSSVRGVEPRSPSGLPSPALALRERRVVGQ